LGKVGESWGKLGKVGESWGKAFAYLVNYNEVGGEIYV